LTELLGKWNDRVVMIQHLQKTIEKAKINTEEITALEFLKIKIAAENNVFLKEIKLAILKFKKKLHFYSFKIFSNTTRGSKQ
jgi:hypothetical protein